MIDSLLVQFRYELAFHRSLDAGSQTIVAIECLHRKDVIEVLFVHIVIITIFQNSVLEICDVRSDPSFYLVELGLCLVDNLFLALQSQNLCMEDATGTESFEDLLSAGLRACTGILALLSFAFLALIIAQLFALLVAFQIGVEVYISDLKVVSVQSILPSSYIRSVFLLISEQDGLEHESPGERQIHPRLCLMHCRQCVEEIAHP